MLCFLSSFITNSELNYFHILLTAAIYPYMLALSCVKLFSAYTGTNLSEFHICIYNIELIKKLN